MIFVKREIDAFIKPRTEHVICPSHNGDNSIWWVRAPHWQFIYEFVEILYIYLYMKPRLFEQIEKNTFRLNEAALSINDVKKIANNFVNSDFGKKYSEYDCKTVTRAFTKWARDNGIDSDIINLAPPSKEIIAKRPELKGKSGEGDGHIMPVVGNYAIDFTARQFGLPNTFENPVITPMQEMEKTYNKIGGYYTDAPEWFDGGKKFWKGKWENQPKDIMNQEFGDEKL